MGMVTFRKFFAGYHKPFANQADFLIGQASSRLPKLMVICCPFLAAF